MDEDSGEKIRRNLVVASATVLLGVLLDLSPSAVVSRVLGTSTTDAPSVWRIWTAVLLLLVYLFFRYFFSDEFKNAWGAVRGNEYRSFRLAAVKDRLRKEIAAFVKTGRDSPVFHNELQSWVRSRMPADAVLSGVLMDETDAGLDQGSVTLVVTWNEGRSTDASDIRRGYDLPAVQRVIASAKAMTRLLLFSESSTRLFVPLGLWMIAMGFVCYRLVAAILL